MLGCAGGRTWQMEGGEETMGWEQGTASYLRQVPAILSLPATGSLIVAGSFLRAIDEICLRFGIVSASKQGIGRSTLMSAVSTCFDSPIVSNRPRLSSGPHKVKRPMSHLSRSSDSGAYGSTGEDRHSGYTKNTAVTR